MAVIGIDSHKDTLVGCLIDADERVVEHRDVPNSLHGHAELVTWAQTAGVERVGIEGSGNYGRPAAQALLAAGTTVVEVPPQMTAAARRGRRTGAKTDHIDALEIARITARDDDLPAPRCANAPDDLQCLVDYRRELVKDRTAAINRLHSALEKIRCGYHTSTGALTSPKGLDAASRLLRGDTTTRAEVARDRITHIRRLNRHIDQLSARIATEVSQRGTSLTDIYGIGALTAAEIITETGDPGRYRTKGPLRHGQRNRSHRSQQRTRRAPPIEPRRQPPAQQGPPHRRHRPDPQTRHRRPRLLPALLATRQDQTRSDPSTQTTHLRPHLDTPPTTTSEHTKSDPAT